MSPLIHSFKVREVLFSLAVGMLRTIVFRFFNASLKLLTNTHAVRGRPTLKDVIERFWNGLVHLLLKERSVSQSTS